MKIARHKKVQRFLSFYTNFFDFRQPYQILIDGTFCFTARQEQINIKEQLPKYLASEVKLLTTKCIIIETETIAKKALGASMILKQFAIHQCNHDTPVSGSKCLLSMIGRNNRNHYCIATQDRSLQERLREIPGVPLIYLHKKTPTLEQPSAKSQSKAKSKEACTVTEVQNATLELLKEKSGLATPVKEIKKRKKKKGGPNPLSCLKSKKKPKNTQATNPTTSGKIKKRKRVKLPTHVKDLLKNQ